MGVPAARGVGSEGNSLKIDIREPHSRGRFANAFCGASVPAALKRIRTMQRNRLAITTVVSDAAWVVSRALGAGSVCVPSHR